MDTYTLDRPRALDGIHVHLDAHPREAPPQKGGQGLRQQDGGSLPREIARDCGYASGVPHPSLYLQVFITINAVPSLSFIQ